MPPFDPFTRCRLLGTGGALLLGAGGWVVGSLPAGDPLGWWRQHGGGVTVAAGALAYTGLVLLVAAWWRLGRLVAAPGSRYADDAGRMARVLCWWAVPLALGPPLFSSDVYSYVAQGAMTAHGLNVYHFGPADLGGPLVGDIPAMWQHVPAPYGPVFIQLADGVVRLTGADVVPAVLGMRAVALASVAVIVWGVRSLARAAGSGAGGALWAGVLNPLVLVHLVAGAHNDALMLALMLAGLALARGGRPLWGVVAVTLAMLVKVPAGLALCFLAPLARGGRGRVWPGVRGLLAGTAVAAAVVVAVSAGTGLGYGWVLALRTPASVDTVWSASTDVGRLLRWLASQSSAGGWWSWGDTDPVTVTRSVGLVTALAACGYWIRRTPWVGAEFALGAALLTLVVLSPVIQPWYVLWGTVPLAVTAWRAMAGVRQRLLVLLLVFTLLPEGTSPTTEIIVCGLLGVVLGVSLLTLLPDTEPGAGGTGAHEALRGLR